MLYMTGSDMMSPRARFLNPSATIPSYRISNRHSAYYRIVVLRIMSSSLASFLPISASLSPVEAPGEAAEDTEVEVPGKVSEVEVPGKVSEGEVPSDVSNVSLPIEICGLPGSEQFILENLLDYNIIEYAEFEKIKADIKNFAEYFSTPANHVQFPKEFDDQLTKCEAFIERIISRSVLEKEEMCRRMKGVRITEDQRKRIHQHFENKLFSDHCAETASSETKRFCQMVLSFQQYNEDMAFVGPDQLAFGRSERAEFRPYGNAEKPVLWKPRSHDLNTSRCIDLFIRRRLWQNVEQEMMKNSGIKLLYLELLVRRKVKSYIRQWKGEETPVAMPVIDYLERPAPNLRSVYPGLTEFWLKVYITMALNQVFSPFLTHDNPNWFTKVDIDGIFHHEMDKVTADERKRYWRTLLRLPVKLNLLSREKQNVLGLSTGSRVCCSGYESSKSLWVNKALAEGVYCAFSNRLDKNNYLVHMTEIQYAHFRIALFEVLNYFL